jgi:tetratricopeptide (TPR) repeat protein
MCDAWNKLCNAWKAGENALALEVSRDLVRESPDFGFGWLIQGVVLYELARYDEAEKTIRYAIKLIPEESLGWAYTHLGTVFKYRGDYEAAERYYRKALELSPDNAGRYVYLGAVLAVAGNIEAAEQVHRDGTHCSTGRIDEACLNLGYVLRAQERYSEAFECFQKALEITPDYKEALAGREDVEKAIEYLAASA